MNCVRDEVKPRYKSDGEVSLINFLKMDIWYTEHNILLWLWAAAQRYV